MEDGRSRPSPVFGNRNNCRVPHSFAHLAKEWNFELSNRPDESPVPHARSGSLNLFLAPWRMCSTSTRFCFSRTR
jgi:hypothetical protein